MSFLSGQLTTRRYRVLGELPDDFRDRYEDSLAEHAFHPSPQASSGEERVGWVHMQNLLDADFSQRERWLMNHFIVAALRIDKKVLPSKLVRAMLAKRVEAWCHDNGRESCPASVRVDLKDNLEAELRMKTLPRVQVYEFCWHVVDGWVLFANTSDKPNDVFCKRFLATFGLVLAPWSPLDFLEDGLAGALEVLGSTDLERAMAEVGP